MVESVLQIASLIYKLEDLQKFAPNPQSKLFFSESHAQWLQRHSQDYTAKLATFIHSYIFAIHFCLFTFIHNLFSISSETLKHFYSEFHREFHWIILDFSDCFIRLFALIIWFIFFVVFRFGKLSKNKRKVKD